MEMFLISKPSLDHSALVAAVNRCCNENLAKNLDSEGLKLDTFAGNLMLLSAFYDNTIVGCYNLIHESKLVLEHQYLSIGVIGDYNDIIPLSLDYGLKITTKRTTHNLIDMGIVTGNLATWRNFVINGSQNENKLATRCYDLFSTIGLRDLWVDFTITKNHSNLLILKAKS